MHRLQALTNMINKNKTKDQLPRLGKRELICLLLFMWFLFGKVTSSSWYWGWAA